MRVKTYLVLVVVFSLVLCSAPKALAAAGPVSCNGDAVCLSHCPSGFYEQRPNGARVCVTTENPPLSKTGNSVQGAISVSWDLLTNVERTLIKTRGGQYVTPADVSVGSTLQKAMLSIASNTLAPIANSVIVVYSSMSGEQKIATLVLVAGAVLSKAVLSRFALVYLGASIYLEYLYQKRDGLLGALKGLVVRESSIKSDESGICYRQVIPGTNTVAIMKNAQHVPDILMSVSCQKGIRDLPELN